jgi:hypothetical protein
MHAILTLHEKIRTGELTRRPSEGIGEGIRITEPVPGWVQPGPSPVHLGTPR